MANGDRLQQILSTAYKGRTAGRSEEEIGQWIAQNTGGRLSSIQQVAAEISAEGEVERERAAREVSPGRLAGTAQAVSQGMTMGFGEDIAGILEGIGAAVVPGGRGFSEAREESVEKARGMQSQFRQEHPWMSFAGEMAGGMLMPGLGAARTAGTAAKGAKTLASMGRGMAIGAGEGAISGFGEAEGGLLQRVGGAIPYAIGGTLLGGVAGAAAPLARRAVRKVRGAPTNLTPEMEARVLAREIASESGRFETTDQVMDELARIQELRPSATLADMPEFRMLARGAAVVSPEARSIANQVLPVRSRSARSRMLTDIAEVSGVDPARVQTGLEYERAQRKLLKELGVEYEEVARVMPQFEGEDVGLVLSQIEDLSPGLINEAENALKAGLKAGDEVPRIRIRPKRVRVGEAGIEGAEEIAPGMTLLPDLGEELGGQAYIAREAAEGFLPFRTAQYLKTSLDDAVSTAYRSGRSQRGAQLRTVRDALRNTMTEQAEGFGGVQAKYARHYNNIDTMQSGAGFLTKHADEIQDDIVRLTQKGDQEALDAYRLGAASSLRHQIRRGARRGDPTRVFDSMEYEDKLAQLFGSEDAMKDFFERLDVEKEMGMTMNQILGGSQTADIQAIVERMRGGSGFMRKTLQRFAEMAVQPMLASGRLGASQAQEALQAAGQRRAGKVGGNLMSNLLSAEPDVAKRLLQTGEIELPGIDVESLMFRGPRALQQAGAGTLLRQ